MQEEAETAGESLSLFHLGAKQEHPITTELMVNGTSVTMEVDTGVAVSIMSSQQQLKLFPEARIQPSDVKLRTYTKEPIEVLGVMPVQVICGEQRKNLSLVVVQRNGSTLLGRDWLSHLRLDWKSIAYQSKENPKLLEILDKYEEVFRDELGLVDTVQVKLHLKEGCTPKFCRPRPVPFAIKGAVEREIRRLEEAGVLVKVDVSQWATPIVPVPKKNGEFRICGDYKATVNPVLNADQHPLPKPVELFAALTGGQ